ncbi:MAG: AraC family transcriptional regulator [Crocinitomicaceae bacterium]
MIKEKIETYHLLKNEPEKRQFDIYDLKEYQKLNSEHSAKPHSHSFYQIIWFKNKTGNHIIDFESYDIKEDRIFFVAKNQVHYFEKRLDYSGYLIHFNESFLLSNETDINFFLTYSIFNNRQEPYFQIPKKLENKIATYFSQIEDEVKHPDEFGNSSILSNLLKSTLLLIEREKRKNTTTYMKSDNSIYLKFRDLLENNFYKKWSVSDFAEELSISTKTLNSTIKSEIGTTVSQAISDRIILEAKRKLTHTSSYINQIAYDLGFNDPYYFAKFFKKQVNCSPSEFRKSIS